MPLNISGSILTSNEVREYEYNSIIRDGLVLHLDARIFNTVSGTTWFDFSGNGNHGTLTNGPTFNSDNGGSIVFDGVDDYIMLPTNFFNHNAGTAFTVSLWFKTSTSGILLGQQNTSTPTSANGYVPVIYIDTNNKIRTSCFWGGATSNQSTSTANVADNVWHNIAVTFASNSHKSYLDGILFDTISKTQTNYSATYYYFIGAGTVGGWSALNNSYFTGTCASMLFYTTELSATEVLHNYNLSKHRFGL